MKIELYEDTAGEWRWRLKANNGQIIAIGGEGFATKHTCMESVTTVQDAFNGDQPIVLVEVKKS